MILDKKSSDFLQKLVRVEISSKTRYFVDILILGDPTPYSSEQLSKFWELFWIQKSSKISKVPQRDRVVGSPKIKISTKDLVFEEISTELIFAKNPKT